MGGRKADHSESMSWEAAVRHFGEPRLIAGVVDRTWKGWREHDSVPAYRIVRLLKESGPAHGLPEVSHPTSAAKEDTVDVRRLDELHELVADLFKLNNEGNEVAQQHWTHLEHQVRTLLRDAEREG